jgi:hypothetical protein
VIAAAKQAPGRGLPPVHLWHPAHCGEIDIVIKKDGLWFHEGTPIGREALVRLFSTVLRKDPDGFHLVTPVEKMKITVEDAPFIAVRVDKVGETLKSSSPMSATRSRPALRTRSASRWTPCTGEPRPYLHVRRGLEALIARPVFYELVELAQERETPDGPAPGRRLERRLVPGGSGRSAPSCESRRRPRRHPRLDHGGTSIPWRSAEPSVRSATRSDFDLSGQYGDPPDRPPRPRCWWAWSSAKGPIR